MTPRYSALLSGTLLAATLLLASLAAQEESNTPPPPPTPPEGVEVQARGPVHEAYAEPSEVQPQPSPLVAKQPPEPVDELPPEQRPEGDNVQWIPGYWAWDQEQNDFLWVSGFWRTPPPGRQWVPGNWQPVEGGWHWVPGFWAPADQEQLQYLPSPPPSLDEGPSTPAPQANSSYVPGCWVHQETRYRWRPGFWVPYHPGWVWIPAHYVWTPAGCLFVEGYWDHPLEARGLLFAPVRLAARLLAAERWSYTPQYVVQPDFLLGALFVRPALGHYYFGDYFEDRYVRAGFVPWIDYRVGRFGYDPNFNYYRLGLAGYGNWERGLRGLYEARFRGDVPRPPRTLVRQNELIRNITANKTQNVAVNKNINLTNAQNLSVLAPLTQVHNTRATNLVALANVRGAEGSRPAIAPHVFKLQEVSREQRIREQKAGAQVHAFAQERGKTAGRLLSEGPPVRVTDKPRQLPLPRTTPQPGERPVTPRPGEKVRPGERPVPPVTPRPGERPTPPPPEKKLPTPRPGEKPTPPAPSPAPRVAPPAPMPPRHEDRPIPKHEPPRPPAPPKHVSPPPKPPAPPAPPPKKEPPPQKKPPPKKDEKK